MKIFLSDLESRSFIPKFDGFYMPDSQPHVDFGIYKFDRREEVHLITRGTSFNELGMLAVASDAIKRIDPFLKVGVTITYCLGARQDRVTHSGVPLTAKVVAEFINSMMFDFVNILHPHSDVFPSLLHDCNIMDHRCYIYRAMEEFKPDSIIIPDAGASKNIHKFLDKHPGLESIQCLKRRNVNTGVLSDIQILGDVVDKRCFIVDDICDGGKTFIELAKQLRLKGASAVGLYVTHGIFSKGFDDLKTDISKIYCTNSYSNHEDRDYDFVKLFPLTF